MDTSASASLTVDPITADDVLNAAEAASTVPVTGAVSGDAAAGHTVSFTLNGTDYSGTVAADRTFRIEAAGTDLAAQTSFDLTVSGADPAGNPFSASTTSTHSVDQGSPTATVEISKAALSNIDNASTLTITFSEAPSGFAPGQDLSIVGGSVGPGSFDPAGLVWSATFIADPDFEGTGSVTLAHGAYSDAALNAGTGGTDTVEIDTLAPAIGGGQNLTYPENSAAGSILGTVMTLPGANATAFRFANPGDTPGPTTADGRFTIDALGRVALTAMGASAGAASNDFETAPNNVTLAVQVRDAAGNWSAPTDVILSVADVNEAPVNTMPGVQNVAEDAELAVAGLSVADPEGNVNRVRLEVTQGTLQVSLDGGATIIEGANGAMALTIGGSQAQINAALATLSYQGNLHFHGDDTLRIVSTDDAGTPLTDTDIVTITVTPVNDAPTSTNATVTVAAGSTETLGFDDFGTFADPDVGATMTAVWIVTMPSSGSLSLDAGGSVFFTPDGNAASSLSFRVRDDAGAWSVDSYTLRLLVVPDGEGISLTGDMEAERLTGGAGDDTVMGGGGADTLVGGPGDDVLSGHSATGIDLTASDVFAWSLSDAGSPGNPATDVIKDFNPAAVGAAGDVLDLRDLLVGESESNLTDFLHFEREGADTVIQVASDGALQGGYDATKVDQTIRLEGADLFAGGALSSDSQVIQDLLHKGKLVVDS